MILDYVISLVMLFILDYFVSKQYKIVFTNIHVFVTITAIPLIGITFWFLYNETWVEDLIRVTLMGLLAEIALYFVVIKYKLLPKT